MNLRLLTRSNGVKGGAVGLVSLASRVALDAAVQVWLRYCYAAQRPNWYSYDFIYEARLIYRSRGWI